MDDPVDHALHAVRRHFDGEDGSYVDPEEPRPLTIYRGNAPVADEAGGSGREPTPAPPAFSYMPTPESVARQAARQPAPETKWPHEAMTEGERLVSNLGVEDLPKGETTMSAQPTNWERYMPHRRQGTFLKRWGEAADENAQSMSEGWKAAKEGNYGSGALGMAGGALGMIMSPLTGMERVLVRDPILQYTGDLKKAQEAEMVADTALTGGVRGMVTPFAKAGSLERMATEPWDRVRMPSPAAAGAATAAGAMLAPEDAEASKLSKAMEVARMAIPRELSPLGFYSHGAEAARGLSQAKGTPEQMLSNLRRAAVKPEELYHSGMVDQTATLAKRTMIESEYAPKIEAAKQAMDALNPGSPEFAQALLDPKSPESKAKRLYENTVGSMRKDMDSTMVLSPEWASRPSVTQEDLAQHFQKSMPQIEERVSGGVRTPISDEEFKANYNDLYDKFIVSSNRHPISDGELKDWSERQSISPTKFGEYVLPGGENYREVRLKLPSTWEPNVQEKYGRFGFEGPDGKYRDYYTKNDAEQAARSFARDSGVFKSQHWNEPDVIAHLRFTDRTGPNGEKVLHVEEIQSDWGQKGRESGFADPKAFENWQNSVAKANSVATDARQAHHALVDRIKSEIPPLERFQPGKESPMAYERRELEHHSMVSDALNANPEFKASAQRMIDTNDAVRDLWSKRPPEHGVAPGPYVTKTNEWTDLALKRALKEAAEGGYDKLVWTPGAEQAKRYSLSSHVDEIKYLKEPDGTYSVIPVKSGQNLDHLEKANLSIEELQSMLGKDVAEKIMANEGSRNGDFRVLSGQDLEMGGEGMKGYYDKIVPKRLQELIKKHDPSARVGYTDVMLPPKGGAGHNNPPFEAPGITITPAMRESILRGQSAHARGGEVIDHALHAVRRHFAGDEGSYVDPMGSVAIPEAREPSDEPGLVERAMNFVSQFNPVGSAEAADLSKLKTFMPHFAPTGKAVTRTGADILAKDPYLAANVPVLSKVKSAIPFEEMSVGHEKIPGFNEPYKPLSIENLEGAWAVPLLSDMSSSGSIIHKIGGKKLSSPLYTEGGGDFPRGPAGRGSGPAGWASMKDKAQTYMNSLERRIPEGERVVGIHTTMSPEAADSADMFYQAMLRQIPGSKITKASIADVDARMAENFPGWPGIMKTQKAEDFMQSLDLVDRKQLAKILDLAGQQKAGFPDVGQTRFAITEPRLFGNPRLRAGYSVSELDPRGGLVENPSYPHSNYTGSMAAPKSGAYLGGLPSSVHVKDIWSDWWDKLNPAAHDPKQWSKAQWGMLTQFPAQKIDAEMIDRVMKQQEEHKRIFGWRQGGEVSFEP